MWWVRVALLTVFAVVVISQDLQTAEKDAKVIKSVERPDVSLDVKADSQVASPENIVSVKSDKVRLCCRRRRRCRRRCCRRRCCRRRYRGRRCRRRRCRRYRRRYRCKRYRRRRCRRFRRRYRCRRYRRRRCRFNRRRFRGRRFLRCRRRYRWRLLRRWRFTSSFNLINSKYIWFYFVNNRMYCGIRRGPRILRFPVRYIYRHGRLYVKFCRRWILLRCYRRYSRWYILRGRRYVKRRPIRRPCRRIISFVFRRNTLYRYVQCGSSRRNSRVRYRWRGRSLYYYLGGRWRQVRAYGQYGARYIFKGGRFVISGHWRPGFYLTFKGNSLELMFRCGRQRGRYSVRYRWRGGALYYLASGRWCLASGYTLYGIRYVYSKGRYITKSRCTRKFFWKSSSFYVTVSYGKSVRSYRLSYRYRSGQLYFFWGGRWCTCARYKKHGVVYIFKGGRYVTYKPEVKTITITKHIYTFG